MRKNAQKSVPETPYNEKIIKKYYFFKKCLHFIKLYDIMLWLEIYLGERSSVWTGHVPFGTVLK